MTQKIPKPPKLPWMPVYPADYFVETGDMTLAERGAFMDLLCHEWIRDAPLPLDESRLAQLARCSPKEFREVWPYIARLLRKTEEGYISEALEERRREALVLKAASKQRAIEAAEARWGKPNLEARGDAQSNAPSNAPSIAPSNAPSNAPSIAPSIAAAVPGALLEQCPPPPPLPATQTVNSNCDKNRLGRDEQDPAQTLAPSPAAIDRAMETRDDILPEDLVAGFVAWKLGKKGPFRNIERSFATYAAKHESTDEERKRAMQRNRENSRQVAQALRARGLPIPDKRAPGSRQS